jgi:hypothetical protein
VLVVELVEVDACVDAVTALDDGELLPEVLCVEDGTAVVDCVVT